MIKFISAKFLFLPNFTLKILKSQEKSDTKAGVKPKKKSLNIFCSDFVKNENNVRYLKQVNHASKIWKNLAKVFKAERQKKPVFSKILIGDFGSIQATNEFEKISDDI